MAVSDDNADDYLSDDDDDDNNALTTGRTLPQNSEMNMTHHLLAQFNWSSSCHPPPQFASHNHANIGGIRWRAHVAFVNGHVYFESGNYIKLDTGNHYRRKLTLMMFIKLSCSVIMLFNKRRELEKERGREKKNETKKERNRERKKQRKKETKKERNKERKKVRQ